MPRFPYQFFENFVVRTTKFSYKIFKDKFNKISISDEELKEICENPAFQEAIYLASPYLYKEIEKWLSGKTFFTKEFRKLKNTVLKYYVRLSTRCTPFDLFSGVGLGFFDSAQHNIPKTKLQKLEINKHQISTDNCIRDTKLDMHFLVALSQHFVQIPEIRNQILFCPNNSIYKIGSKIRYIEYEIKDGKREYSISSAPLSEELNQVLEFSKQSKTIKQIAEILINSEINLEEAEEFIEELIENQMLVTELEPVVSGDDFLNILISVLQKTDAKKEAEILRSIKIELNEMDENIENPVSLYTKIEELIQSFKTEYEQKFLFQTDLYFKDKIQLSNHWKKELKKGISFLNKIALHQKETTFETFKKAFSERFETQEVSLLYALDTEIGIGYRQDVLVKGIHPYLEDLELPKSGEKQELHIKLNPVHTILNKKLQQALLESHFVIELSDGDFKDFEENWKNLPDTISFMAEIISENNQEKLVLNGGGGSSAANLLGRFCSEKSEVQNLTKVIAKKVEELNSDKILAEVIHLPEARIGNIIRRPTLRNYEIPYLAKSVLPKENQIPVEDLYISLRNDRIVLRSKKLNKEIKPHLTNAHNYYTNTLPIYHFLCDLHSQNKRTKLYFDWGGLEQIYHFLPRVEYENIILSKAQWKVSEKEISQFSMVTNDKERLSEEIKNWRNQRKIPQWIQWVKSDNALSVNLENDDLVKMFVDAVKNEKHIIIQEFLLNENDDFKREFVFPMYQEEEI